MRSPFKLGVISGIIPLPFLAHHFGNKIGTSEINREENKIDSKPVKHNTSASRVQNSALNRIVEFEFLVLLLTNGNIIIPKNNQSLTQSINQSINTFISGTSPKHSGRQRGTGNL